MAQHRSGDYVYEKITDWPKMPKGQTMGVVSRVATDSQDRVYVFQRKDPPVVVFDRDGNYLGAWGTGAVKEVAVFVFGSRMGYSSVLSSGDPYSGP